MVRGGDNLVVEGHGRPYLVTSMYGYDCCPTALHNIMTGGELISLASKNCRNLTLNPEP